MSKFVLQPVRILMGRFVTDKTKPSVTFTFAELKKAMVSSDTDPREAARLGFLSRGAFVGLSQSSRNPSKQHIFLLISTTGDIGFVTNKDPSFPERIREAYRVDEAQYDAKITELPVGKSPPDFPSAP